MRITSDWHALFLLAAALAACSRPAVELGAADYAALKLPMLCHAADRPGAGGSLETSGGVPFQVRAPRNYDGRFGHPLIVVFAPAGFGRLQSERFANLSGPATHAGFLVAYSDHRKLAMGTFRQLGEIPMQVARRWCVDEHRVYLAGHSDGGTTAAAVTFLMTSSIPPAAIAVSGAGIREQDLAANPCAPPVSVMVLHSRNDKLFPPPDFGREAAQWWAACNRCEPAPATTSTDGCLVFRGCWAGVTTRYCETALAHEDWPPYGAQILAFFTRRRP